MTSLKIAISFNTSEYASTFKVQEEEMEQKGTPHPTAIVAREMFITESHNIIPGDSINTP